MRGGEITESREPQLPYAIRNGVAATAPIRADNAMIEGSGQALLAYFMTEPDACDKLLHRVSPEVFSAPTHRKIFAAIQDLHDEREKVNLLTVSNRLVEKGELKECGDAGAIANIATSTTCEDIAASALDCILDDWRQREAVKIGKQLAASEISVTQAREKLDEIQKPLENDLPSIDDGAELIAKPIVLPDDVIDGVLHRGGKGVFAGSSKAFKTWILTDVAASVATGTLWLGKFPTKRGRVLYINLEIQSAYFAKRLKAVCDERQIKLASGYLRVWNLRGYACDLSGLLPRLLRGIGRDEFVLIIIDPVYKLLGKRDENAAGDIASLLNEIESLAVKTGAAVLFGAHYSKGNQSKKESIDRVGGSGVFARDPDSILNFTSHEQADCFTVEATLRNHAPIDPFVVRWTYPLMVVDDLLDPARLKLHGAALKQYSAADVADLLTEPMTATELKEAAEADLGLSKTTFYRLLRELKTSRTVVKDGKNKWKLA